MQFGQIANNWIILDFSNTWIDQFVVLKGTQSSLGCDWRFFKNLNYAVDYCMFFTADFCVRISVIPVEATGWWQELVLKGLNS